MAQHEPADRQRQARSLDQPLELAVNVALASSFRRAGIELIGVTRLSSATRAAALSRFIGCSRRSSARSAFRSGRSSSTQ